MLGARGGPHLLVKQAILRVASRRIRSDILPRRRVGESARGVLGGTPQQACPVLDTGKDEGNDADGRFSAACRANSDAFLDLERAHPSSQTASTSHHHNATIPRAME